MGAIVLLFTSTVVMWLDFR